MKTQGLLSILICPWLLVACGHVVPAPLEEPLLALPAGLDPDSERLYATHRHLFEYDPLESLDIKESGSQRMGGIAAYDLTYRSPKGGRVPATLLVPDGTGPFPGIVMMHGMPSDRRAMLTTGTQMARVGAVVILIDAPFARPENLGRNALTLTEMDREEQIQLIVGLRRAIDVLLTRCDVDAGHLAFFGVSYGGAIGGLLAGVEDRLQAYVLVVGDGGLVTHLTGPEDWPEGDLYRLPKARRDAWLEAMWPIEPLHYVGQATPAALFYQNGTQDSLVPPADAQTYQKAGSRPKDVLWYEAGHRLPPEAFRDSVNWLEPYLAAGSLLLLKTSFCPGAVLVDRLLTAWLVLTAGTLLYLLSLFTRDSSASWATILSWVLTALFFGPFALLAYLRLYRRVLQPPQCGDAMAGWQRALGSTLWGAGRNMCGGVLAVGILLALPDQVDSLPLWLVIALLIPLATGLLVNGCTRWAARDGSQTWLSSRRPVGTELLTTIAFLLGAYPLVFWFGENWLAAWYPLGADLSNPAAWAVLILAAWAGAATSYPVHLLFLSQDLIHWGPSLSEGSSEAHGTVLSR